MAIRLGVTLGIPDHLAGGQRAGTELAADCGTEPRATVALLRFLAARQILTEIRTGVFALAELGEELLDELPQRYLNLDSAAGHMDRAWAGLPHAVRTGKAGYPDVFDRDFWDHLDAEPALAASFDDYMDFWAAEWMPHVAEALADLGSKSIVDVGGGTGGLLVQLLSRDPALRGTLVELPAPAARARDRFAEAGLATRCSMVEGSFFDPLPAGEPLYVLAQVLHDWPDEQATAILRRCADAAGPDGRIVLVERVLDEQAPELDHVAMDLRMLVLFGAHERSAGEYAALAACAGLQLHRVLPAGSGLSLVELTPTAPESEGQA